MTASISIHALRYRVRSDSASRVRWICSISIHALRYRVRLQVPVPLSVLTRGISIHALRYRVRCDRTPNGLSDGQISIHALRYRVRWCSVLRYIHTRLFQSTHSVTECDILVASYSPKSSSYFNPRTPLQSAMAFVVQQFAPKLRISIHALRYRVRSDPQYHNPDGSIFQSTHSVTECDFFSAVLTLSPNYFNPRTPLQSAIVK